MRFRWKRKLLSGRKLLCFACLAIVILIVYQIVSFIDEEGAEFDKPWTCEELRARERLIELVSICFFQREVF